MSSFQALCACLSFYHLASVTAQSTYSYTPASSVPSGASKPLSPSFAGLGIEPSNLFSFTGGDDANELSINLLQNLANYTGTPPHLRIGGNTQDYMIYESSHTAYSLEVNSNPTESSAASPPDYYIIGPGFFEALDRFPTNSPITFGLNLAYQNSDWKARINATASAAYNLLTNVNLTSFEIGNEPDLYLENGFRTGDWSGEVYTEEWLDRAYVVYNSVLEPNGIEADFFEPGCTASTIGTTFTISDLADDDITAKGNDTTTSYVAMWNQHDYYYYIGVSTYTLTMSIFTDLSTTATQFAAWTDEIDSATELGYRYALREMGVVGPIGMRGMTDVFAASLWTLNFFLYAASLNISSVQMHMTDNSNASAWQPVYKYGNEPFVRPNYYAFAAMAQLIGCGGGNSIAGPGVLTSGVPSGYTGRLAIYDSYRDSKLAAIVIINSVVANTSETDKSSITIDLSLPDFEGEDLYLSYLTADGADSYYNTTFNGVSFEQNSVGLPSTINSTVQTVTVGSDGSASVTVRDSQALIVNIGKVIGETTCSNSSSNSSSSSSAATLSIAAPRIDLLSIFLLCSFAFAYGGVSILE